MICRNHPRLSLPLRRRPSIRIDFLRGAGELDLEIFVHARQSEKLSMFRSQHATSTHRKAALSGLYVAIGVLAFAPLAQAQFDTTVDASGGLSCAADRGGGSCTAKEFTVTVAADQGSNIQSCQFNLPVTLDVVATITSKQTDRYDIGLFIGENGNSPDVVTPGSTCSVATFPTAADTTSTAWFDASNSASNTCGDYHGGGLMTVNLIHNVTVKCLPDSTGVLAIPYALSYVQNVGGTCTGANNVAPGAGSKCVGGGTPVAGVIVTYNADPACTGKNVAYDPAAGTVTSTFTITNNDPNNAVAPNNADGTQYHDLVPGPVVVTGAACQVVSGAASCGTGPVVAGNDVSGTLPTLPTGAVVKITINGTVPAGNTGQYSNTADVIPPANLTAGSDSIGNNSCSNSVTLPVKLQSFDVH
jgi:hypothetical protein